MFRTRKAGSSLILSAFVVATSATMVSAGSVTFNLGGNGTTGTGVLDSQLRFAHSQPGFPAAFYSGTGWQGTESDTDGDVTLTITPGAFTQGVAGTVGSFTAGSQIVDGLNLGNNALDNTARVTQSSGGLGVMNNGNAFTDDAPFDVDRLSGGTFGTGWHDFLVLEFDREVTLDFAQFSNFDRMDSFRLIYDADNDGVIGSAGDFLTDALTAANGLFDTFADYADSIFGIAAIDEGSAWRFQELGVSWSGTTPPTTTPPTGEPPTSVPPTSGPPPNSPPPGTPPTPDPAPVPLPAAGWMLIAGLGGLLAMRKARRS
ncbi:MAG: VPLPA-CTERM sorting domain-containing protein [Pseudomonadota bacterium]